MLNWVLSTFVIVVVIFFPFSSHSSFSIISLLLADFFLCISVTVSLILFLTFFFVYCCCEILCVCVCYLLLQSVLLTALQPSVHETVSMCACICGNICAWTGDMIVIAILVNIPAPEYSNNKCCVFIHTCVLHTNTHRHVHIQYEEEEEEKKQHDRDIR